MLWCLLRLGDCLLCHGSGEKFASNCSPDPQLFDHGHSGRSRGFRHSGGRAATHQVLSLSSELVDTATARRQQRVEDATRVGLQFPFRQERRGRGAPSVAMKWRDAVNAAIMHGLLPPDVTLDAPYRWHPGMPLLPLADCR